MGIVGLNRYTKPRAGGTVEGRLGSRNRFEGRGMYSVSRLTLQVVSKGWMELGRRGRSKRRAGGKPTAKPAITLLVKLADGHLASFSFCRAVGATMGARIAG